MRLTDGTSTFALGGVTVDDNGPVRGFDAGGRGYSRCDLPGCHHSRAPDTAVVWHDDEYRELWRD